MATLPDTFTLNSDF